LPFSNKNGINEITATQTRWVISFKNYFLESQVFLRTQIPLVVSYTSPDEIAFVRWHLKGLEEAGAVKVRLTPSTGCLYS
jgi:hypothetical protein